MVRQGIGYDSYWKLPRSYKEANMVYQHDRHAACTDVECDYKSSDIVQRLETAGYGVEYLMRSSFLRAAHRVSCDHFNYEACFAEELWGYMVARGLDVWERVKTSVITMARVLEAADANPKFEKFMELPAEIRILVYQQYMAELPDFPYCPVQPPITKTCRIIRNEALPRFYESMSFEVYFESRCTTVARRWVFRIHQDSYSSLSSIPARNLAEIAHIRIFAALCNYLGYQHSNLNLSMICNVDLSDLATAVVHVRLSSDKDLPTLEGFDFDKIPRDLEDALKGVFTRVRSRPGTRKLRIEDFFAARRVIEEVCFPKL